MGTWVFIAFPLNLGMEKENCYGCDWNNIISQYVNSFGLLSYMDPFVDSVIENVCESCRPEIPDFYKNRCNLLFDIEGMSKENDQDVVIDFAEEILEKKGISEGMKRYFLHLLEISLDQR
jgi:hypothetical protein